MSTEHLNLARKWRSRDFDQVIGQDLSVRILKNSLYLQHFFPVYLFSGQHGCGKTTTARIFAGAVNCANLELFQKDPKNNSIPCLQCRSCLAMAGGNHPDFIEIDGASHTGVDNVRHIIDIAAFLPLIGRKKIYLIDEAHMLSKAAFNAFLKILEEPPASALFILATTELHKIIETVRSRSFQLIFRSVSHDILLMHLENICQQEKISYERDGLLAVVKQAKGSVRDALNLLEQVRFESSCVTKASALRVFGHTDDGTLIQLFEHVIQGDSTRLLQFLSAHSLENFCVETVWKSLIELLNTCIWVSYKIGPKNFVEYSEAIQTFVSCTSVHYFNSCLELLYEHELLLQRTGYPWHLFEMLLLRMCQASKSSVTGSSLVIKNSFDTKKIKSSNQALHNTVVQDLNNREVEAAPKPKIEYAESKDSSIDLWKKFIGQLGNVDPMLSSLFKQAYFEGSHDDVQEIHIIFGNEFNFFNDIIQKSESIWKPLLTTLFQKDMKLTVAFKQVDVHKTLEPKKNISSQPETVHSAKREKETMKNKDVHNNIDTSNTNQWKKASLLKTMFAGTIREIAEGSNE